MYLFHDWFESVLLYFFSILNVSRNEFDSRLISAIKVVSLQVECNDPTLKKIWYNGHNCLSFK